MSFITFHFAVVARSLAPSERVGPSSWIVINWLQSSWIVFAILPLSWRCMSLDHDVMTENHLLDVSMSIPHGVDANCRIKSAFHQPVRKSALLNCTYGRRYECKEPKQDCNCASLCAERGQNKCFAISGSLMHLYSKVAIEHAVAVCAKQGKNS